MNGFTRTLTRNTRWLGWVTVVFLAQVALIYWLTDYSRPPVRKPIPAPTLALAGRASSELLSLNDPTLFALPHFRGFSGDAWLNPPSPPNLSFEWTEEPRWLTLATEAMSRTDLQHNKESLNAFEVLSASAPEPSSLILRVPPQFPERSGLRVDGALARRKLLLAPELPSWISTNLLTNTVVRIMVNSEGLARSETLLVKSGLKEADDYALKTARSLRFQPLTGSQTGRTSLDSILGWGDVVFQWHGVPPGTTNR